VNRQVAEVERRILERLRDIDRLIVAIAGPPGSGKSTFAEALFAQLRDSVGDAVALFGMDGFHLDNAVLDRRGLRARKGAPESFDANGYLHALQRLRDPDRKPVALPVFDRSMDLSRAAAVIVEPKHRIVLTEGNYLLLDEAPWSNARQFFDLTIYLDARDGLLEDRLRRRWLDLGLSRVDADKKALDNDMPNALLIKRKSVAADITLPVDRT
jgi:pantothenate kinase